MGPLFRYLARLASSKYAFVLAPLDSFKIYIANFSKSSYGGQVYFSRLVFKMDRYEVTLVIAAVAAQW